MFCLVGPAFLLVDVPLRPGVFLPLPPLGGGAIQHPLDRIFGQRSSRAAEVISVLGARKEEKLNVSKNAETER